MSLKPSLTPKIMTSMRPCFGQDSLVEKQINWLVILETQIRLGLCVNPQTPNKHNKQSLPGTPLVRSDFEAEDYSNPDNLLHLYVMAS